MAADLTPAELIAELERRADRADLASAFTGDKTAREIYADALALVRPVVERLERERDDARTAASHIADAFVRACPAKAPTIKDLIIGQRGDPDA